MPNKKLIEKCLLPDREFNKLHFNCLTPAEVVKSCDKLNYAQLMFAIPIIAEEIKNMKLPEYTNCKSPIDRLAKALAIEVQLDTRDAILDLLSGENT